MPGRDGTGPNGKGSGTGRGLGPCQSQVSDNAPADSSNEQNPGLITALKNFVRPARKNGNGARRGKRRQRDQ